ncbi:hypothetical protein L3476_27655 [Paenibacillus thiaminolyticus]|uniref:hypothetical protein n=1 Tax=Paenibacillus thiaminolyticus TaxID=49283 RepID=UPI002350504E|nr:hypothetical protein [Paenibacillus thiaminolyticus]WCR26915.1 hypothetical protein L3476_27655 [Paenibacillus thiaminolyticus]
MRGVETAAGRAAEEGKARILHMYRNLRGFSSDLIPFLQKRIIFADFCFESIGIAEIPAVFRLLRKSKGFGGASFFMWRISSLRRKN